MIEVSAAVIEKDGRILIGRRRPAARQGLKWEFPGGKREPRETPEECLRRELAEELGIETEIGPLLLVNEHDYGPVRIRLMTFRVRHVAGDLRPLEHKEVVWAALEELGRYDFAEADLAVVDRLRRSGLPPWIE